MCSGGRSDNNHLLSNAMTKKQINIEYLTGVMSSLCHVISCRLVTQTTTGYKINICTLNLIRMKLFRISILLMLVCVCVSVCLSHFPVHIHVRGILCLYKFLRVVNFVDGRNLGF